MNDPKLDELKKSADAEMNEAMVTLKKDAPGVYEGIATALGATGGGTISLTTLSVLGVSGFSGAGIMSGLATAGSIVGGGALAGIFVLSAPVLLLGVGAFAYAKKRKHAKNIAALNQALKKLYNVQEKLMTYAEKCKKELAGLETLITLIEKSLGKRK